MEGAEAMALVTVAAEAGMALADIPAATEGIG